MGTVTHTVSDSSVRAGPELGVIEGFFGRPWSWTDRSNYPVFLKEHGFDFYIYAPKADHYLRKNWQAPASLGHVQQLAKLRKRLRGADVDFGLGFSPFEIYLDYSPSAKVNLKSKIRELNLVNPDILCILFDDMKGDIPDLAALQVEITTEISEWSTARRIILCPTYYSFDPLLEAIFGTAPECYLSDIGRLLPQSIDVFWTGPKICSSIYPQDHFLEVIALLQRKPFLWDNSIANDIAEASNHLHLDPPDSGVSLSEHLLTGHAVNPMNQAWLSRLPLRKLIYQYHRERKTCQHFSLQEEYSKLCGRAISLEIVNDLQSFQSSGLAELDECQRKEAIRKYEAFSDSPYGREIVAWLQFDYAFDPDCLT